MIDHDRQGSGGGISRSPCASDEGQLVADLFASSLILDNRMGGRRIRKLMESSVIQNLRDLCTFTPDEFSGRIESMDISDEEKKSMVDMVFESSRKEKAKEKAEISFQNGIRSINCQDDDYPKAFRNLDGMPLILYGIGDFSLVSSRRIPAVTVVGSRQASPYGVKVTKEITRDLARHGVGVISGLARGIDTVAHETTLKENGKTIAVTAGGLDQVYPPENQALFERICETGLVLSEMPPTQRVLRQYFPARNRILSALSDVVAIMEAGEFSGTLHTASFGAAHGRDVFVVPGGIYQNSYRGSLLLIQDGAEILLSAEDILARLAGLAFYQEMDEIRSSQHKNLSHQTGKDHSAVDGDTLKKLVMDQLIISDRTLDELSSDLGLSFMEIAPVMSELELSGAVKGIDQRFALTFLGT